MFWTHTYIFMELDKRFVLGFAVRCYSTCFVLKKIKIIAPDCIVTAVISVNIFKSFLSTFLFIDHKPQPDPNKIIA